MLLPESGSHLSFAPDWLSDPSETVEPFHHAVMGRGISEEPESRS